MVPEEVDEQFRVMMEMLKWEPWTMKVTTAEKVRTKLSNSFEDQPGEGANPELMEKVPKP